MSTFFDELATELDERVEKYCADCGSDDHWCCCDSYESEEE